MDFGNGDVVDNLPFQQCQLRCLELGPTLITAEAYCCSDPDGFAMQAMALHTCVTQDVCPGDLDGDQAVGSATSSGCSARLAPPAIDGTEPLSVV